MPTSDTKNASLAASASSPKSVMAFASLEDFRGALGNAKQRVKSVGGGHRAKISLFFPVCDKETLRAKIQAMGIRLRDKASNAGVPAENIEPPYADTHGDDRNPGVSVVFKTSPAQEKLSIDVRSRKKTTEMKAWRPIIEKKLDFLVGFFGAVLGVACPGAEATDGDEQTGAFQTFEELFNSQVTEND